MDMCVRHRTLHAQASPLIRAPCRYAFPFRDCLFNNLFLFSSFAFLFGCGRCTTGCMTCPICPSNLSYVPKNDAVSDPRIPLPRPLIFAKCDAATSGFEICFAIGSQHLCRVPTVPTKPRLVSNPEPAIKKCDPRLFCDLGEQASATEGEQKQMFLACGFCQWSSEEIGLFGTKKEVLEGKRHPRILLPCSKYLCAFSARKYRGSV